VILEHLIRAADRSLTFVRHNEAAMARLSLTARPLHLSYSGLLRASTESKTDWRIGIFGMKAGVECSRILGTGRRSSAICCSFDSSTGKSISISRASWVVGTVLQLAAHEAQALD
jgi:hypothetical protein